MNNYIYIISSLPVISRERNSADFDPDNILAEIKGQLSKEDCRTVDFLLDSFDSEKLTEDYYKAGFSSKNSFIREYLRFDLNMRNAKVHFINKSLERPYDLDVMQIDGGIFEEQDKMDTALSNKDFVAREKAIDNIIWDKISEITLFDYFDLKVILAFIAKMHIVDRWLKLDPQTGRERFIRLVEEIRGTFKGVEEYFE